jgi:hypothetical protein
MKVELALMEEVTYPFTPLIRAMNLSLLTGTLLKSNIEPSLLELIPPTIVGSFLCK